MNIFEKIQVQTLINFSAATEHFAWVCFHNSRTGINMTTKFKVEINFRIRLFWAKIVDCFSLSVRSSVRSHLRDASVGAIKIILQTQNIVAEAIANKKQKTQYRNEIHLVIANSFFVEDTVTNFANSTSVCHDCKPRQLQY